MIKPILILIPFCILIGIPVLLSDHDIVPIINWFVYGAVVASSTAIVAFKLLISDYINSFTLEGHSIQLSEMALIAFIATLSIQLFNSTSILTSPSILHDLGIPTEYLTHFYILGVGTGSSLIILIITAFIASLIRNKWKGDNNFISSFICYFFGLLGYSLYVSLFLFKVVR